MSAHGTTYLKLLVVAAPALFGSAACLPSSILERIETYTAPPYPAGKYIDREPYDYRLRDGVPVPGTLADTLVLDIWVRIRRDADPRGSAPPVATSENVTKAIHVYLERDWTRIAGSRPWTHWHFIRSLTAEERLRLADEVAARISEHGVRDPTDPPDYLECALVLDENEVQRLRDVPFTIVLRGAKGGRRLCLSYIRDRPHRWVFRQRVGEDTWTGPTFPIEGDPYDGPSQFVDLQENDRANVEGKLWIHNSVPEGDYLLLVSVPHWPDPLSWVSLDTWPEDDEGCWLGEIISKGVPLKVTTRGRPAEPSDGSGAATPGEGEGRGTE